LQQAELDLQNRNAAQPEGAPSESPGSIPNFSRIELKTTYCYYVTVFGSAFCLA